MNWKNRNEERKQGCLQHTRTYLPQRLGQVVEWSHFATICKGSFHIKVIQGSPDGEIHDMGIIKNVYTHRQAVLSVYSFRSNI